MAVFLFFFFLFLFKPSISHPWTCEEDREKGERGGENGSIRLEHFEATEQLEERERARLMVKRKREGKRERKRERERIGRK